LAQKVFVNQKSKKARPWLAGLSFVFRLESRSPKALAQYLATTGAGANVSNL
jgi:hypothetical protein